MTIRNVGRELLVSVSPSLLKRSVRFLGDILPHVVGDRELRLLPALVDPGRPALDVGMHYGLYAIFLEHLVGPTQLYGCEPLPSKLPTLRQMFPRSTILPIALSDSTGTATLRVPMVGHRLMTSRATLEAGDAISDEVLTVQTESLDALYQRGHIPDVGFAKIDVEGHEEKLLLGAHRVLRECRPTLVIEIEQRHHTQPLSLAFQRFAELEYRCFFLPPKETSLRPSDEFDPAVHQDIRKHGTPAYVANFIVLPAETSDGIVCRAANLLQQ